MDNGPIHYYLQSEMGLNLDVMSFIAPEIYTTSDEDISEVYVATTSDEPEMMKKLKLDVQ